MGENVVKFKAREPLRTDPPPTDPVTVNCVVCGATCLTDKLCPPQYRHCHTCGSLLVVPE